MVWKKNLERSYTRTLNSLPLSSSRKEIFTALRNTGEFLPIFCYFQGIEIKYNLLNDLIYLSYFIYHKIRK